MSQRGKRLGILDFVLGRRLANREYNTRKIGAFEGLPAMGLDGISSSSYGPEAALTVLMVLGASSVSYLPWVMGTIIVLLGILCASYWQTIRAYPSNGGAYIVAKENLGTTASLLAAAALMIDYVLNVAVGISAGVGALVSAAPMLHPYILPLCLVILLLITLVNLRGTMDAGRLFAVPTYLFIVSFLTILAIGVGKGALAAGGPQPVVPPSPLPAATEAVSLWLFLRAFASGCTAMTGVEAVSNGMSAFRDPAVTYGHRTLGAIVSILAILLAGIAYLAKAYHIGAMDQTASGYRSVLSQLAGAVIGNGAFYYIAMGSLLCVLTLSATTSFVDFPRLCRLVAQDDFLPRPFAIAGRRLVFSVGITYLAACAGLLLLVFDGITDRLIPLFAIGAFLTFTLSQSGMVVHWRRALRTATSEPERRAQHAHFWINTVGAISTGAALVIIVLAKFIEGAWITILAIPCTILLLKSVHRYYQRLTADVRETEPLNPVGLAPPIVLVMVQEWDKLTTKALRLALSISADVIGIHLIQLAGPEAEEHGRGLRNEWHGKVEEPALKAGLAPPRLVFFAAEYRAIHEPVLKFVRELPPQFKGRRIVILIPEVVKQHWYQHVLHAHYASYLRTQLLYHGGTQLTVLIVPWHLDLQPRRARSRHRSAHAPHETLVRR